MTAHQIPCQLIVDGPLSGDENMAIDAQLLDAAVAGQASLRFYQWNSPTVSLGHFQNHDRAAIPERFQVLAIVRRLSGGGAILHDREVTYSIAIPAGHPIAKNPSGLYDVVHEVIIRVLGECGIHSELRGAREFAEKPFLCFARGDARDIVIGDHKIVGSAQRRRAGAILQHGSILLNQSAYAPEFPGIEELTNAKLSADELVPRLAVVADAMGLSLSDPTSASLRFAEGPKPN